MFCLIPYFSNAVFKKQNSPVWRIQFDWYCLFGVGPSIYLHMKGTQGKEKIVTPKIVLFYNKQHAAVGMTASHSSLPFSHKLTKSEDCAELESF